MNNLPDPKLTERLDAAMPLGQAEHSRQLAGGYTSVDLGEAFASGQAVGYSEAMNRVAQTGPPILTPGQPLIFGQLIKVMQAVTHVGKTGFNEQQKYNFRGIDATVNAIGPALREHGVLVVPTLLESALRDTLTTGSKPTREAVVKVQYTFYAEDGSNITAVVPGESLDQSDKGAAKAMSVAFRIALLQVFALPTDEPDPDASYHTRDGVGSMGAATKQLLLSTVPQASIPDLDGMWAIVLEHSAAERAIGEATITWADYFAQRVVEVIDTIETPEYGRERYEELKVSAVRHLRFQDKPVTLLMGERAAFIKQRSETAVDRHVTAIGNAGALEELDIAHEAMNADYDAHVINTQQKIALLSVIGDKRVKLERELNQPESSGSES